jgi:hypothetical protein
MKNVMTGTFSYNNEDYNFNFVTDISAVDKLEFVDFVVGSVVDEDDYNSIVRDLIFDFGIIEVFTNIDTSFVNEKDDDGNVINPIILIEHFLENTNIIDIVKANMELGLLDELNRAVDKSIEYRTGIHLNPLNEALTSLVNTIEKKINNIDLSGMMEAANILSGMTEEFTLDNIVNAYIKNSANKDN